MPRPPTRPSVLRTTRQILGLSQTSLARLAGCSKITIEKFENGTAGISKVLARRISFVTELDLQQLLDNSLPDDPMTESGEPITLERFEAWQKHPGRRVNQEQITEEANLGRLDDEILLAVAARAGKYREVVMARRQAKEEIFSQFGLDKAFQAELRRRGLPTDSALRYVATNTPPEETKQFRKLKQPGKSPSKRAPQPL